MDHEKIRNLLGLAPEDEIIDVVTIPAPPCSGWIALTPEGRGKVDLILRERISPAIICCKKCAIDDPDVGFVRFYDGKKYTCSKCGKEAGGA